MEKARVRLEKYGSWFLVNFVICLLPIVLSALISWKVNDDVFVSYVSFIYTLLITGLYSYFNSGRESDLTIWITMFCTLLFLAGYVVFPRLLRPDIVIKIRGCYIYLSLTFFVLILFLSWILNKKGIEDQVQNKLSQLAQKRAAEIEGNVNNMYDQLKNENL